jgi:hypothetical protein
VLVARIGEGKGTFRYYRLNSKKNPLSYRCIEYIKAVGLLMEHAVSPMGKDHNVARCSMLYIFNAIFFYFQIGDDVESCV